MCIIHTRNYFKSKRKSWSSGKTIVTSFTKAVELIWTSLMTKPEKTSCFVSCRKRWNMWSSVQFSDLTSRPTQRLHWSKPEEKWVPNLWFWESVNISERAQQLALSRTVSICWLPLVRSDLQVWRQTFRIASLNWDPERCAHAESNSDPSGIFAWETSSRASQSLGDTRLHPVSEAYILFILTWSL